MIMKAYNESDLQYWSISELIEYIIQLQEIVKEI